MGQAIRVGWGTNRRNSAGCLPLQCGVGPWVELLRLPAAALAYSARALLYRSLVKLPCGVDS